MKLELHIITLCLLVLAADPARRLVREVQNWLDRRRIHQQSLQENSK
jgi:hypothetical protein